MSYRLFISLDPKTAPDPNAPWCAFYRNLANPAASGWEWFTSEAQANEHGAKRLRFLNGYPDPSHCEACGDPNPPRLTQTTRGNARRWLCPPCLTAAILGTPANHPPRLRPS